MYAYAPMLTRPATGITLTKSLELLPPVCAAMSASGGMPVPQDRLECERSWVARVLVLSNESFLITCIQLLHEVHPLAAGCVVRMRSDRVDGSLSIQKVGGDGELSKARASGLGRVGVGRN